MGSNRVPEIRNRVLAALPATGREVAEKTGLSRKSVNNAFRTLHRRGDAYPTGSLASPVWVVGDDGADYTRHQAGPSPAAQKRRDAIYALCTTKKTRREISTALGIPINTLSYDLEWLMDCGRIDRLENEGTAAIYVRSGGALPETFRTITGKWAEWVGVTEAVEQPNGEIYTADARHPTPQPATRQYGIIGSSMETFINRFSCA